MKKTKCGNFERDTKCVLKAVVIIRTRKLVFCLSKSMQEDVWYWNERI